MKLFVASHVIEEKLHIPGNILLGWMQIQIGSIKPDNCFIRKYLQLWVFASQLFLFGLGGNDLFTFNLCHLLRVHGFKPGIGLCHGLFLLYCQV